MLVVRSVQYSRLEAVWNQSGGNEIATSVGLWCQPIVLGSCVLGWVLGWTEVNWS